MRRHPPWHRFRAGWPWCLDPEQERNVRSRLVAIALSGCSLDYDAEGFAVRSVRNTRIDTAIAARSRPAPTVKARWYPPISAAGALVPWFSRVLVRDADRVVRT